MKKIFISILLLLSCLSAYGKDKVEEIMKKGVIRIGTTGDYKPFTYLNGDKYEGYDIEVAKLIAKELGVKVEFIPTTWKTLISDLNEDKYDVAMGGITRTVKRQVEAQMSNPYLIFGKCYLVRKGEKEKYNSIEAVNKPSVKVGVNIGGTNEIFADEHLSKATIIRYKNNLDVPVAVEKGEVDVMVTENPEAITYEKINSKLEGALTEATLTKSQMGYMVHKDQQHLLNTINFILAELEVRGTIPELKNQYLK
ncbi:transporter substrate-binding domain-containing protein [Fusobacterium varium]|uniref:Cyclohexadienyl dehydratase n=1 Tax=Fusobacterium varium ATCC 27725 TaxID=469618 RepID=A0ABM6U6K6_FUSVA|nr:transporter substrate-binding domain-containing protein [Fusobacterium varium]AVQ32025.1 cyclohexadienyl dehydratase [Fusobacterium varium ATCC 27725]EES63383.1 ABC transporter, substrate-binding protein, family 3 [Fusobacterium varium ATCC 27725]RHG36685.1 cyclohexadienyl dehydratase [Fusobacterium varium]VEH39102.1 Cyclohexadienyl dehydratase precursor [Fusobacterium varium]